MSTMSPALLALVKGAKNKYGRSDGKIIKFKEGKTTFRVLPFQVEDGEPGQFWFETAVHWIKTETNGKPVAVCGCDAVVHSTSCKVCSAIELAKPSAVSDEDAKLIKEWNAKKGVLIQVLILSGSDASPDNPQIVELTPTTFSQVMSVMEEYSSQCDITDPQTGMNLVVERSGKGLDTKYQIMTTPTGPKTVAKGVMEKCVNLKELVEKEFFRGDEVKAITAISNMTGISLTGISAPRNNALLTSAAAKVEDVEIVSAPKVVKPTMADKKELAALNEIDPEVLDETPPFEVAPAVEDDEEAALMAQMAALKAKKAAAAALAAKPAAKPKAAPKVVAPAPVEDALTDDDVASVLAELDNI